MVGLNFSTPIFGSTSNVPERSSGRLGISSEVGTEMRWVQQPRLLTFGFTIALGKGVTYRIRLVDCAYNRLCSGPSESIDGS